MNLASQILCISFAVFSSTNGAPAKDFPIYRQDNVAISKRGWYQHGAVASDTEKCSQIGKDMLQKGGSAIDAGIAALFCNGVMDQMHMGLGGGTAMIIYESPKTGGPKELVSLDADVRVPLWMENYNADVDNVGPENDVLVPGELAGYRYAWERYGRLPWKDLITPSINLATEGWNVTRIFAAVCREEWQEKIMANEGLRFFRKKDPVTNEDVPYSQGDVITDPMLGNTLSVIANEGADTFYNGKLSELLLQDMEEYNVKITKEDLEALHVKPIETIKMPIKNGQYYINTPGIPFYGHVLAFITNIMEAFDMKKHELATLDGITLFYHRYMEAWKFFSSLKICVGDTYEHVPECSTVLEKLLSKDFAHEVKDKINNKYVLSDDKYDLFSDIIPDAEDHGTSHLSILTAEGSAFSATSTISMSFGSRIKGTKTGVVFNDRLLSFNHNASLATALDIVPGVTGYSCRIPTIVTNKNGDVVLVLGTSGGARIVHATALALIFHIFYDLDLQQAIDYPKIAQFGVRYSPSEFMHELQDEKILQNLRNMGQNLKRFDEGFIKKSYVAVTQGISRKQCHCNELKCSSPCIEAVSDFRKGGAPDGY